MNVLFRLSCGLPACLVAGILTCSCDDDAGGNDSETPALTTTPATGTAPTASAPSATSNPTGQGSAAMPGATGSPMPPVQGGATGATASSDPPPIGDTAGATGATAAPGATGPTGATGVTGATGPTGATASPEPSAPVGDEPAPGDAGADDPPPPLMDDGTDPTELAPPNATIPDPIVTHVFTADPSAYAFEGRIYVYASHDPDDQMAYDMVDYHVFSSNDLANWQDHGVVLDAADVSFATKLYAPDCAYDAGLDKYFLYFPDAGSAIGVAVSDDPGGPFENPIQLISPETPGVGDVDWIFDPTAFFDDDGQGYLYFGGGPPDTGDNARVMRLNPDRVSMMDSSATTIVAPDFFEAAFMLKRDGKYYFSYSTTYANHAPTIDYMISDDPMTGFEYVGTVIPAPEGNNGDNNHHSMVEYEGQWYVFYHSRVLANRTGYSGFQRSITLDKMTWSDDGLMNPVSSTRSDVQQLRSVDAFARIEGELLAGQSGIETDFAVSGGQRVGVAVTDLQDGDWLAVSQLDFKAGATTFRAHVASEAGGTIEVLQGGCEGFRGAAGSVIGTCEVAATGGSQNWTDTECAVQAEGGVHDLCLRFSGGGNQLMNLDYYVFE